MKKIAMFMSAVALAFTFASCDQTSKDPIDLDNVTEDGFYVAGPATGAADIAAENAKGNELSIENAVSGMAAPFHAGAAKYFAEKGETVNVG